MRLLPLLLPPLLLLPAACTTGAAERAARDTRTADDAAGLQRELAGLRRGETTDCLPPYRLNAGTRAYGSTIVYVFNKGLKYASQTTGGCERAGIDTLVTRTTIGRTCRGDIATVIDPVARIQTGSCAFGDFTEYRSR